MAKTCASVDCTYPVFGKGLCKGHQWKRTDKKPKVNKPVKIKPISKKLAKERKTYKELRLEFLDKPGNLFCAVYPDLRATEVHHMIGREGKRLNDTKYWLAVSRQGHEWIENFPELAKQRGYSQSRLNLK